VPYWAQQQSRAARPPGWTFARPKNGDRICPVEPDEGIPQADRQPGRCSPTPGRARIADLWRAAVLGAAILVGRSVPTAYAPPVTGVPLFDELMANAWRPAVSEVFGGWRYRWTGGVTRRANSALALGGEDLDGLILKAENFYRERGANTMVQLSTASAPQGLASRLEERGYQQHARTLVQQAAALDVAAGTEPQPYNIACSVTATDEWFEAYWSVEAARGRDGFDATVCRNVLLAPALPAAFVAAYADGRVVGTGQLVIERGWAGVQRMTTAPNHRRRGVGRVVLRALATEALRRHVERMYLAVEASNEPALSLYASAGFEAAHEYSYFIE
jgi:GNAT superfamily N-acetyltransferase